MILSIGPPPSSSGKKNNIPHDNRLLLCYTGPKLKWTPHNKHYLGPFTFTFPQKIHAVVEIKKIIFFHTCSPYIYPTSPVKETSTRDHTFFDLSSNINGSLIPFDQHIPLPLTRETSYDCDNPRQNKNTTDEGLHKKKMR